MFPKFRVGLCLFLLTLFLVSSGGCSEPGDGWLNELKAKARIRGFVKNLVTDIDFFGRVLDQNDQPVIGGEVEIHVTYFEPKAVEGWFNGVRTYKAETGIDGRFELTGIRGWELFVLKISAPGYEYDRQQNPTRSFKYRIRPDEYGVPFTPDKNNPVIFRMRKKLQDRTFLFDKPMWAIQILSEESGMLKGTDFIEGKWSRMPGEKSRDSRSENCDLFYWATYDEETGAWHVVLKPGGPDGGILASDRMLYVAPEDGYELELSFVPVGHKLPDRKYLYIRSRSPAIYTRIETTYVNANRSFYRLSGKVVTNPYGDRVLDSVDFPPYSRKPEIERMYQVQDRLEAEAKAAHREGRLPPRPKIMALIEAAKRGDLPPEGKADPKAKNPK